ncbi:hypothetical protein [Pseudonocardia sp. TMWB2A]|uniref:hypothetical protein n=1 Tax=Pseudonocardia sp. TMWB2A TaxID=687430 RepID=UPI00307CCBB3
MSAAPGTRMIVRWLIWFDLYLFAGIAGIAAIRWVRGEPITLDAFIDRIAVLLVFAGILTAFQVTRDLRTMR